VLNSSCHLVLECIQWSKSLASASCTMEEQSTNLMTSRASVRTLFVRSVEPAYCKLSFLPLICLFVVFFRVEGSFDFWHQLPADAKAYIFSFAASHVELAMCDCVDKESRQICREYDRVLWAKRYEQTFKAAVPATEKSAKQKDIQQFVIFLLAFFFTLNLGLILAVTGSRP
jgi:hypothetical protein